MIGKSSTPWVAILPPQSAGRAASVRLDDHVQAAFDDVENVVWLRGNALSQKVLSLPFLELYRIDDENRLFPLDAALPTRRLPEHFDWASLSELILPEAMTPLYLTGETGGKAPVSIVRGGKAEAVNLLRISLTAWREFSETAPEIRLHPLTFAASESEVLVRGNPLPAIPGEGWIEREGIALKAGFHCEPAIAPAILNRVLNLMPGEIALISEKGIVERIAAENFIPASRAAARLTAS